MITMYEPERNELLERAFPAEQCDRVLTIELDRRIMSLGPWRWWRSDA